MPGGGSKNDLRAASNGRHAVARVQTSKKTAITKRHVISQFRTAEILEAARRVFARKGFAPALVEDIAAEAGIAKGTIYLYFKSKADIYRAALRDDLLALGAAKRNAVASTPGPTREKLHAYVAATFEYCERRKDFFRIFLLESGTLRSSAIYGVKELRALACEQIQTLSDLIKQGQQSGEIRGLDQPFLINAVDAMIKGVIERRVLGVGPGNAFGAGGKITIHRGINIPRETGLIVDFLWNGLNPSALQNDVEQRKKN